MKVNWTANSLNWIKSNQIDVLAVINCAQPLPSKDDIKKKIACIPHN